MDNVNIQQVLSEDHVPASKDLMEQCVKKGLSIAHSFAGFVLSWYHNLEDDSNIKQVITEERIAAAKELAKRGTEVAQQVLEDERVGVAKEYADQGVKVAHDVAGSVSDWYQELEPGYFSHLMDQWSVMFQELLSWLSGPQAAKLFIIWSIVVLVVFILMHLLGFGKAGVIAGSMAAAWQSYAYGAFTPLGGLFAFLTSMAMLGRMQPVAFVAGVIIATCTTVVCFFAGVGKPPV